MTFDEKTNKMFELKKDFFQTKELNEIGFDSRNINKLIEQDYINRVERGIYKVSKLRFDNLLEYLVKFLEKGMYDIAIKYLVECSKYEDENKKAIKVLYRNLVVKNNDLEMFSKIFCEYLDKKDMITSYEMLILYLLNYLVILPERYQMIINCINRDVVLDNFKDCSDRKIANYILNDQFVKVYKSSNFTKEEYTILINLCNKISGKFSDLRYEVKCLVRDKKYEEALLYLKDKNLFFYEKYVIYLLDILININKTQEIHKIKALQANNCFDAIDKNLFEKALEFSNIYSKNSTITLLLEDINLAINNIVKNKKNYVITKKDTAKILLKEIKNKLENNEIDDELFNKINEYLGKFKKRKYNFVVFDLIKLSIVKKDFTYSRVIQLLDFIIDEYRPININNYINHFD